jgi:hypothetical protein
MNGRMNHMDGTEWPSHTRYNRCQYNNNGVLMYVNAVDGANGM